MQACVLMKPIEKGILEVQKVKSGNKLELKKVENGINLNLITPSKGLELNECVEVYNSGNDYRMVYSAFKENAEETFSERNWDLYANNNNVALKNFKNRVYLESKEKTLEKSLSRYILAEQQIPSRKQTTDALNYFYNVFKSKLNQ